MNRNQFNGQQYVPQTTNYLAYDSASMYDKYNDYALTNFEGISKSLNQPSNIFNLENTTNLFPHNNSANRQADQSHSTENSFNQEQSYGQQPSDYGQPINYGNRQTTQPLQQHNQPYNSNQLYNSNSNPNQAYNSQHQQPYNPNQVYNSQQQQQPYNQNQPHKQPVVNDNSSGHIKGIEVLNRPQPSLQETANYYQCPVCFQLATGSCDCE
jgi:hypothetical protein